MHASFALRDAGYDTVMVNCNPETVSTDYDTSSRLYFEPLTLEDVLEVVHAEQQAGPVAGVIVQLGGQTPLGLAKALKAAGVPIVGTSPEAIDLAEDRGAFGRVLARGRAAGAQARHGLQRRGGGRGRPARSATPSSCARPTSSAGAAWRSSTTTRPSRATSTRATIASPEHPVLVDRFLDDAIEIDVDALYDGTEMYLGGIMEHIEEAGIHSGDSACTLPPVTLGVAELERVREATLKLAEGIGVRGLMNVQFALAQDILYVLEANPRASRTVPFVAKATGVPLAKAAARVMLGATIEELREEGLLPPHGDGGTMPSARTGRGQGGGAAVQAVPHPRGPGRRQPARAGDALHRRGHGHRQRLRAAFAKAQLGRRIGGLPARGHGLRVGRQPRQARDDLPGQATRRPRLHASSRPPAPQTCCGATGSRPRSCASTASGDAGEASIVDLHPRRRDRHGRQHPERPATPGPTATPSAPRRPSMDKPIVTTVQELAAAVQGIEAQMQGDFTVKSLQEHARDLDLYGRHAGRTSQGVSRERGDHARIRVRAAVSCR